MHRSASAWCETPIAACTICRIGWRRMLEHTSARDHCVAPCLRDVELLKLAFRDTLGTTVSLVGANRIMIG